VMVDHDNKIFERISADKDDPSKVEERINFQMNTPIRVAAPLVDKVTFNAKKTGVLGTATAHSSCYPFPRLVTKSRRPRTSA